MPGPVDPRVANPPPVAPPPRQNGASLPAALEPSASQASTASTVATQDLLGGEEDAEAGEHDQEHDQEDLARAEALVPAASDPYAALDSVFGGYLADEPRPQQSTVDDLLF